jgi:hypothetical protein
MAEFESRCDIRKTQIQLSGFRKTAGTVAQLLIKIAGHTIRLIIHNAEAIVGHIQFSELIKLIHHVGGIEKLLTVEGGHRRNLFQQVCPMDHLLIAGNFVFRQFFIKEHLVDIFRKHAAYTAAILIAVNAHNANVILLSKILPNAFHVCYGIIRHPVV